MNREYAIRFIARMNKSHRRDIRTLVGSADFDAAGNPTQEHYEAMSTAYVSNAPMTSTPVTDSKPGGSLVNEATDFVVVAFNAKDPSRAMIYNLDNNIDAIEHYQTLAANGKYVYVARYNKSPDPKDRINENGNDGVLDYENSGFVEDTFNQPVVLTNTVSSEAPRKSGLGIGVAITAGLGLISVAASHHKA